MQSKELLQVPQLGLILRTPRVHPLDDCGHITEHDGVHQGSDQHHKHGEDLLDVGVGGHVAEADASETARGEVQGGCVSGVPVRVVEDAVVKAKRELRNPAWKKETSS